MSECVRRWGGGVEAGVVLSIMVWVRLKEKKSQDNPNICTGTVQCANVHLLYSLSIQYFL